MKKSMMKKTITCLALALFVSAGATVFAAEYNSGDNSVAESQASGYQTVLITKGDRFPETLTDDYIVYADQETTPFDAAASFMLKGEAIEAGTYLITFGNVAGESKCVTFVVSNEDPAPEDVVFDAAGDAELQEEKDGISLYKKGFKATLDNFEQYKTIKINNGTNTGTLRIADYYSTPETSGKGSYVIGVQIYNIPDDVKDILSISFSADE